jgi:hypothetical protein
VIISSVVGKHGIILSVGMDQYIAGHSVAGASQHKRELPLYIEQHEFDTLLV